MTENDYIDQIRFRIEAAERRFLGEVRALHSSQAAASALKSGETISKTLGLLEEKFAALTDEIIAYLGKTLQRTQLDRATLLTLTSQLLMQSQIAFVSICDKQKLLGFVPGSRIEVVIDDAIARVNTRLTLRLREFSFGLDDASPTQDKSQAPTVGERMNSRELRERVLIALYRWAMREGLQGYYDPKEVAEAAGLKWRAGQLRAIMVNLSEYGLVRLSQTLGGGDDGGMDFVLTQPGLEEAEDLIERNIEYQEDEEETYSVAEVVPASNRYVTLSDNQKAIVSSQLEDFKEGIRGDNGIDEEGRQIALSEIVVFEASIAAPRVATELIERFIKTVLKGAVVALATAAVGVLAEQLIETLASII